jgi:hypothetical protein
LNDTFDSSHFRAKCVTDARNCLRGKGVVKADTGRVVGIRVPPFGQSATNRPSNSGRIPGSRPAPTAGMPRRSAIVGTAVFAARNHKAHLASDFGSG